MQHNPRVWVCRCQWRYLMNTSLNTVQMAPECRELTSTKAGMVRTACGFRSGIYVDRTLSPAPCTSGNCSISLASASATTPSGATTVPGEPSLHNSPTSRQPPPPRSLSGALDLLPALLPARVHKRAPYGRRRRGVGGPGRGRKCSRACSTNPARRARGRA